MKSILCRVEYRFGFHVSSESIEGLNRDSTEAAGWGRGQAIGEGAGTRRTGVRLQEGGRGVRAGPDS